VVTAPIVAKVVNRWNALLAYRIEPSDEFQGIGASESAPCNDRVSLRPSRAATDAVASLCWAAVFLYDRCFDAFDPHGA
jgi:hypothetical protein